MAELQGQTPEQAAVYRRVVESIVVPAGFASLREEGEWAALAFGALHEGWLCCESVVADPRRRGRGHARRLMSALLAWGAARGARAVCLQVAADNAPALALYRSLGLRRELYRYHYRREAEGRLKPSSAARHVEDRARRVGGGVAEQPDDRLADLVGGARRAERRRPRRGGARGRARRRWRECRSR